MEPNKRTVEKEGVYTALDEKGELIAILRRDPVSKKHLVYLVKEACCEDIGGLIR